ncbi:structural maintenance of chromosomes protein 2 [Hermetia illucens]|uniref:structural maintenance of chromosomes protein 2 n=1 Tax=Hermetia illucens TaxID=343691 RepID=UPI0018CC2EA5|nr:structural maintenance of chromosomes protein 2 [Hermetia illucens]
MERKSYSMSHFKSKTVPDRSQTYCNAEVLLKTLKINGKFTVESVLEAIQHYIRKIDELTLQNKLMRDKLEHYRILAKSQIDTCLDTETSTDIPYLQQRINNLLKELHGHRKIEDDRIKLKSQINKMALIIKQLSQRDPDKPSNERLIAGDITGMHADRERLKDLLDKMLGIEGKIIEFKRQAANAAQLQTEVNKLRQELQKERSKEVQKIDATVEQYRKQAQRMESELQVCKKERDLYERVTKKLEIRIKKAINDREIYEKKAEELDCKYEKALFELEKLQTKNAELLLKEPVKKDTVLKELKLALHECRGQLRCAEKLNSEYEEKVNKLSVIQLLIAIYVFRYKARQPTTLGGQFVTSPNLVDLLSANSM